MLIQDQEIAYTKCSITSIDSAFDGDEDCLPMTTRFKLGDCVRRVGDVEVGKIIFVNQGYAAVDFSKDGKILTAYLPLEGLERLRLTRRKTIKPGDSVRPKGCRLVGTVIHVTDGHACVDFVDREIDGQILTGVYPVEDLEIRPEEELSAKGCERR